MNRKKSKKNKLAETLGILIMLFMVILIVLVIVVTSIDNIKSDDDISEVQSELEIQKQKEEQNKKIEEDVVISKLAEMEERERMEFYVSKFIKEIEASNYENAYAMLYDVFKENYFPTITEFEDYAKKTFPKSMAVKHVNIERSSNTYVLYVEISDMLASKNSEGKEMNFVIREDELNKFELSFSVI